MRPKNKKAQPPKGLGVKAPMNLRGQGRFTEQLLLLVQPP